MKESCKKWTVFFRNKIKGNYPRWPSEPMIKLLFGDYLLNRVNIPNNAAILDVGCGFGNNLLPFQERGMSCYGVEITKEISKVAEAAIRSRGYNSAVKVGSNRSIPFKDNSFDLLISSGVIHYEASEDHIHDALKEYCRILKPKGALFVATTGPQADLFKRAKKLKPHHYRIKNYDFRDGQEFFFFENQRYLHDLLQSYFMTIETGQVTEKLMKLTVDSLIAVCQTKLQAKGAGK